MKDADGDLTTCRYGNGYYEAGGLQSAYYPYISSDPFSTITVLRITILINPTL